MQKNLIGCKRALKREKNKFTKHTNSLEETLIEIPKSHIGNPKSLIYESMKQKVKEKGANPYKLSSGDKLQGFNRHGEERRGEEELFLFMGEKSLMSL